MLKSGWYSSSRTKPSLKRKYASIRTACTLRAAGETSLAETLDRDGNGILSEAELSSFLRSLQEKGVPGAALEARVLVLSPTHNFSSRGEQAKDCSLCHSEDAKFYSVLLLEVPDKDGDLRTFHVERGILTRPGRRLFVEDFYLLGESKIRKQDLDEVADAVRRIGFKWVDLMGCFMVAFTGAAVSFYPAHGRDQEVEARASPFATGVTSSGRAGMALAPRALHCLIGSHGIQLRLPDSAPIFATFLNAVNCIIFVER